MATWHHCKVEGLGYCYEQGLSPLTLVIRDYYDHTEDGCNCEEETALQVIVNFCPECGYKRVNINNERN
jgi:hypothetical protein